MVAHENQLTDLEEAQKKELNLLNSLKGSQMDLDEYLKQVDEMLSMKVHSIRDFQNQISQLRNNHQPASSKSTADINIKNN